MNRRGFLKLCGMVVAMPSLPVGTTSTVVVANSVGPVATGAKDLWAKDLWAKDLFEYSMSNMVLTNYIVNEDGSHTMKDLIRRFPLEAA